MRAVPPRDDRTRVWPNMLTYSQSTIETMDFSTNSSRDKQLVFSNGNSANGGTITATRDTLWCDEGKYSAKGVWNNSADTFINIGGDGSFSPPYTGMRLGMAAGHTYLVCATLRLTEAQTSAKTGNAQIAITCWYATPTSDNTPSFTKKTISPSAQGVNAAGVYRLYDTFAIPSNAYQAFLRLYFGYVSGTMWVDRIGLFDVSARPAPSDWWCPGTS